MASAAVGAAQVPRGVSAAHCRAVPARMASRLRVRERVKGGLSRARLVLEEAQNGVIQLSGWYESRTGRASAGEDDTPAVLEEDVCLVPGQPVVRVEDAPGNARRIFTGIDIVADGCENVTGVVWNVLTDYANLALA